MNAPERKESNFGLISFNEGPRCVRPDNLDSFDPARTSIKKIFMVDKNQSDQFSATVKGEKNERFSWELSKCKETIFVRF